MQRKLRTDGWYTAEVKTGTGARLVEYDVVELACSTLYQDVPIFEGRPAYRHPKMTIVLVLESKEAKGKHIRVALDDVCNVEYHAWMFGPRWKLEVIRRQEQR